MKLAKSKVLRAQMAFSVVLGVLGFALLLILFINISDDLEQLKSANSDNVQWTLSQTEVEFLEFEISLDNAEQDAAPDLAGLRKKFDIFYSRIRTLSEASIYAPIRELDAFSENLAAVDSFLQRNVDTIDAQNDELISRLPELAKDARSTRPNVRSLSNSGLNFFASESDNRRKQVRVTLSQMAISVAILLFALMLFAYYLVKLNLQNMRRRREAIQASERMNIVTSTALDAVIVCDQHGVVLDFNAAAEQIFGYEASQAIGADLGDLIVPDTYRAAHNAGMKRMRESGEKRVVGKGRVQLEGKRANGEVFPTEFAIQSAQTKDGEIFVSFLRDISLRVAAEKELVEARDRALAGEKSKTDFLATMSHEIRTPLNGLLGNLTLLSDTNLDEKQRRYIANMDTSGTLLMNHISDVLDITKYDAGKLQLRPVPTNVNKLLQDIVDNQSGSATANGTTLVWDWSGEPAHWVMVDEERLQQVLLNVIGNAVKFTRNGKVCVTATMLKKAGDDGTLEIVVEDNGIGMSPELRVQIFDDFMTGDSSYDRDVGGTGLGLGIADRFIKAMDGKIDVHSEAGEGSTFLISLPVTATAAPKVAAPTQEVEKATRSGHVLLVEDNEINRIVAREMLLAAGHTVTEAFNGLIAVEKAESQRFDLILMDISMPEMDGRAATRAIRASSGLSADTPIVALTANAMEKEQEAFLSDGMNSILTKPLSRAALLEVLAKYLGNDQDNNVEAESRDPVNQHLQELQETLGNEALRPLIKRFCSEVEDVLALIEDHESEPHDNIAKQAHKIAGSAASLGASELRSALIQIENAAKFGDKTALKTVAASLPEIWQRTQPTLEI